MIEYKGHRFTPTVTDFSRGRVTVSTYSIRRGDQLIYQGTVNGSFDTPGDAIKAAEAAAQRWIDQQGS